MIRTLSALALLAFAMPMLSVDASAASAEVKAQKQEAKDAKKYSKLVGKQIRKWSKGADKGKEKKMAKADSELTQIVRDELARLREMGVKTQVVEPEPINRKYPGKVIVMAPEFPNLEARRDELVELRDLQSSYDPATARAQRLGRMGTLLDELGTDVADRADRKDRMYQDAKSG